MSTILTQSAAASFPDRPGGAGVGLMISMVVGDEGALLAHDLGAEQSVLHVRFMFNPWGVSGGRFVPLVGLDGANSEVLRMTFDAGTRGLEAWMPGGSVSTVLDGVLPWQCVEFGIDTISGEASLWINGVQVGQFIGDLSATTVQTIWFGAVHKQTAVAGDGYMDELCIADAYIGPVIVPPSLPHAGDPSRWLVVYNSADSDAVVWAEAYRQVRGVPYANLAGLALPTTEIISAGQYAALVGGVEDYLTDNNLAGQVMGILVGYRVPGYVDFSGGGPLEAVPALMQTDATTAGTVSNAHAAPIPTQRPTFSDMIGDRMTARMDAFDSASAGIMIDRASSMIASGLGGDASAIYFDPFVGTEPTYQDTFDEMIAWATGLRGMNTRLPIVFSGDPSGNTEAGFEAVSGDGLFIGWSSTLPDPDFFSARRGAGRLAFNFSLRARPRPACATRSPTTGPTCRSTRATPPRSCPAVTTPCHQSRTQAH